MKTILLTAIGGDIAQGVATIVREEFPDWRIIGADMKTRHGGQIFVDTLLISPAATDPVFEEWLATTIAEHSVDYCLPLSEVELAYFLKSKICDLAGAQIVSPGFKALEVGGDKLVTANFLAEINVLGPWTKGASEQLHDDDLPCIYKPRTGAGSKSIFVCKTYEEAMFYAKYYPGGIFQELLEPDDKEITCAVYRTNDGDVAVLQLLRTLVGGFTGWAEVIEDAEVLHQCVSVANHLDLRGSINIQLRLTSAGPRIFEINARFSSTTLLRHKMGFRDAIWTLKELLGAPVDFEFPQIGTIGVRVQNAAIIDLN